MVKISAVIPAVGELELNLDLLGFAGVHGLLVGLIECRLDMRRETGIVRDLAAQQCVTAKAQYGFEGSVNLGEHTFAVLDEHRDGKRIHQGMLKREPIGERPLGQ